MTIIGELVKLEPYKSCFEYGELIGSQIKEQLEEHDKRIRADAIDEFIRAIGEKFQEDKIALFKLGKIAEELKEQNK